MLIVTAEPSGDVLATGLAATLSDLRVACATGGPIPGTESVRVPRPASVMGLLDAVRALRQTRRALETGLVALRDATEAAAAEMREDTRLPLKKPA